MTTTSLPPAFIMISAVGGPQMLAQAPIESQGIQPPPVFRRSASERGPRILRSIRPDLLLGLAGFAIGAAAILLVQVADPGPPPPHGDTNVLVQAAMQAASARPASSRG
ncbi:MAG TPA: hypothetical protein VNT42_10595 [Sphingomonas sp.]|nr:hypothetical protein [Sphingomonas sp.]